MNTSKTLTLNSPKIIQTAILAAFLGSATNANAFVLRRIDFKDSKYGLGQIKTTCTLRSDSLTNEVDIQDVGTASKVPFELKAQKIDQLIKKVSGIPEPDTNNYVRGINWWVQADEDSKAVLIRTHIDYNAGKPFEDTDKSPEAELLATLLGEVCMGQRPSP